MIYVPHGWIHDVVALDDSVSITWNLVHSAGADALAGYLADQPERDSEFAILRYFHELCGITDLDADAILRRLQLADS